MTEPKCVELMKDVVPGRVLHRILWFLTGEENTKLETDEEEDESPEGYDDQQQEGWVGEDNEEK